MSNNDTCQPPPSHWLQISRKLRNRQTRKRMAKVVRYAAAWNHYERYCQLMRPTAMIECDRTGWAIILYRDPITCEPIKIGGRFLES